MDIKNYLHFYLGHKVIYNGNEYYLESLQCYSLKYGERKGCFIMIDADDCLWVRPDEIKPILRQLSDMTEEEHEAYETFYMRLESEREEDHHSICEVEIAARTTHWLLSKSFDLFGLIDAGLAINSTTLNNGKE